MVVVLPEPFGPRSPKIVPGSTDSSRPSSARVPSNVLINWRQRSAGVVISCQELQLIRILPDGDDAAGDDRLEVEGTRPRDERVALGAGIEPHLGNSLLRDLVDDALADVGRHV